MDLAQLKTKINQEDHRFELRVDDYLAKIDFKENSKGWIYMTHTEVPEELGGKGVGHKLVRESLAWLEKNNHKVVPLCPFVKSFIIQNLDDYKEMIAEGAKL